MGLGHTQNRLKGKNAIVTGSAMGIGRSITLALLNLGVNVAGLDIKKELNRSINDELREGFGRFIDIECDVSNADAVKKSVDTAAEEFGGIDILINNAGIFELSFVKDADYDSAVKQFRRIYDVNAAGTYACTLAAAQHMISKRSGRIINIVTNHIWRDKYPVAPDEHAYDASKYAQLSITQSTAVELKPFGISVNALCPAATDTPMLRSFFENAGIELSKEKLGEVSGIASLMQPEDVALAAVNMLNWPDDEQSGQFPLLVTRQDCEKLRK